MLTLNKRYLRNVKKNFSFYLFSTLLTVIAICLFLCFHAGINGEKTYLEEFRSASCVEDGEFTLPAALTTEDISEMESKYHVTVEKNQYANYESGAYTLRCFSKTEKVNVYRVVEGEDATAENEVVISVCNTHNTPTSYF